MTFQVSSQTRSDESSSRLSVADSALSGRNLETWKARKTPLSRFPDRFQMADRTQFSRINSKQTAYSARIPTNTRQSHTAACK